jgi:hypothetical protein
MRRAAGWQWGVAAVVGVSLAGCGKPAEEPLPPTATPTPAAPARVTVQGYLNIGDQPGNQRIATLELYSEETRLALLPLRQPMVQLGGEIRELQGQLRELRRQIGLAGSRVQQRERLQEEIAQTTAAGRPDAEAVARAQKAIEYYDTVRREFVRLGPNFMPIEDPYTGEKATLNAHQGLRQVSLDTIDRMSRSYRKQLEELGERVAARAEVIDIARKRIREIDEELEDLNPQERREKFLQLFRNLRLKTRQLALTREIILRRRENTQPVAVTVSDEAGNFILESDPANLLLLVIHQIERPTRDAGNTPHELIWLQPIDGMTLTMHTPQLDPGGAVLDLSSDALAAYGAFATETDSNVDRRIASYIAAYPHSQEDAEIADWVNRLLR